ncbi:MAG: nucleotidyl transferase AbiEii/AbiGii toxin family protein [Nitrososphaerales archaeon]
MSGEPILLFDTADGSVSALIRASDLVVAHAGLRVAVIGGLAVTCRLAAAHRPTQDVDVVAESASAVEVAGSRTAAENLIKAGVAALDSGSTSIRLYVGPTTVEIIETEHIGPSDSANVEPERARLFVLSHRWGLESASDVVISVVGNDVRTTVPVATSAALVAMKLHSIQSRIEDRKRASDAWDIFGLLEAHNASGEIGAAIVAGPEGLGSLVTSAIDRVFRTDVTRTRRWVQGYGEPLWIQRMTDAALVGLATELIDSLEI